MQKVLLHCQSLKEAQRIQPDFEKKLPFELKVSFTEEYSESCVTNEPVHLMISSVQKMDEDHASFLQNLREYGFHRPILVLAESVDNVSLEYLNEKLRLNLLYKPYEMSSLRGLSKKLMAKKLLPQQRYRRFRTNEKVSLQNFTTGETFFTSMFNLSRGGAYFEFKDSMAVQVGDLLKMQVNLGQVEREHSMSAKVIWTTPQGNYGRGYGTGVRFLHSNEVYREIMEKTA